MTKTEKSICQYSQITDVGCVRELNEDSIFSSDNLWLVADGMGGHACGEVASKLAVEEIVEQFTKTGLLNAAIESAHAKIIQVSQQNLTQTGMGTTIVALTSTEENYQISWVGDSRAYLWDKKRRRLTQLTEDHSLIVRLIKSNIISIEEAKNHPQRHMITQCLGSLDVAKIQVDSVQGQWKSNQQILLCSDGMCDEVREEEFIQILEEDSRNQQKLLNLVDKAKQAGSTDNISVILIDSPITEVQSIWDKITLFFKR